MKYYKHMQMDEWKKLPIPPQGLELGVWYEHELGYYVQPLKYYSNSRVMQYYGNIIDDELYDDNIWTYQLIENKLIPYKFRRLSDDEVNNLKIKIL